MMMSNAARSHGKDETMTEIKRYDEHPDGGGMREDELGAYVRFDDIKAFLEEITSSERVPCNIPAVDGQEIIDFLYKHGDLTYSAAARSVQLLAGNGYGFSSSSQERADNLRAENVMMRKALNKIADMIDSEDGDLDDAITIAILVTAKAEGK